MKSKALNNLLPRLQFRIDSSGSIFSKPKSDYQPLPWLGLDDAHIRGESTHQRWDLIRDSIDRKAHSLKDIGCCVGFFCFKASEDLDMQSIGIDANESFLRMANFVRLNSSFNKPKKVDFHHLDLNPETSRLLPTTDVTVLLSVWHHWVFDFGLDEATKILQRVWETTKGQMFFETGEDEIIEEFSLPVEGDMRTWVTKYLESNLSNSGVRIIGETRAGNYEHYKIKNQTRALFEIQRL
jgi:SAM-dependent methyltransferase